MSSPARSAAETLDRLGASRQRAAEAMSEAELERGVRRILKDLEKQHRKVLAYHVWSSKNSAAGYPDWCFCGSSGVMWRELKRQAEDPTPDQQEWLDALTKAGMDAGTWRPSDLLSRRVARELAALAGIGGAR